jgi:AcrR family transcriptional regulator
MSHVEHGKSLPDLLGSLASDISGLFRKEVQLAKAEAGEKIDLVLAAAQKLAIGAVLGIGAVGVLFAAIVSGLAAILIGAGMDPTLANSLSALIVAAVFGAIAWTLISGALNSMKASKLNLDRTVHSLTRDAQVVSEKF